MPRKNKDWKLNYKYQQKYDAENVVRKTFKLFKKNDADIIEALDNATNKMAFVRAAIRYYIANGCPEITKDETDDE